MDRVDDARIEKLVGRVRAEIEPDPLKPRYLLAQRGRGHKLVSKPISDDDPRAPSIDQVERQVCVTRQVVRDRESEPLIEPNGVGPS
jgi:hypothetical protein